MGRGLALGVTVQATHFDKSSFMSCIPVSSHVYQQYQQDKIKNQEYQEYQDRCNVQKSAMVKKMWKIARRQIELEKSV